MDYYLVHTPAEDYTQVNDGAWATSTATAAPAWAYVGQDSTDGQSWHIRAQQNGATTDEWVRQADGYIAKLQLNSDTGMALTLTFDAYNVGAPPIEVNP